jgi:16S rRNA (cytosine967-C5)-methyltransferase
VLLDAPYSGTSTLRHDPDARWRMLGAGLETLVPQLGLMLASAARLVKPGGRLVYATCSMLAEENEAQVEGFLAAHPGWRVVPVREVAAHAAGSTHSAFLALTPAWYGTDGFFAAVMERSRLQGPRIDHRMLATVKLSIENMCS